MGDKQKQQQQQNEQQTFAHFFGNLEDFNSEIKELKDIKIEQNDPFQRERLQIFLGASSTSNIQKKVYKDKVCAVKEMPLIRYFNIKNLINYNENYKYLFEGSEDQEYQASRCGLRLIKKIYQFRIIKDKIPKPLQCVVTSQDSSKMSLNLMMKRTSNIMQFPLNIAFLIVKRVAEALQLLHSKNLCHGNVCPNNIFVSNYIIEDYQSSSQDNQSVYLHDSGMHYLCKWDAQIEKGIKETSSKIKEEDIHVLNEFQFVQRNHIQFIAPELIAWFNPKEKSNTKKKNEGDQQNNNDQQQEITEQTFEPTEKSDIYQLGLCLLCMCNTRDISSILSLLSLKQELQITLIGNKIEELELKQVKDKNRDKIKQLLKQMLEFNPKIRLSAQAVIERADSIYKSLIKKPMNDDGFQEIHDIEQYEMKGFIENFDEYLEYQRQQTIQKLQDVCKVVPNKQNPRSELIKNALNVIDQHIKSTRNFTISMMKSQCKQINENSEKQQLISQINEFNFVHYQSQYSQHGYFNMIVLEKNKMIRLNLFDYLIFSEEKTEKQQLESFQYTLNTNENQKKQSLTIQSCIFLDSMSFITLDSQLEMNLWNIDLNKPILSNSLSDFDIQTVQLLNLSQNKIIIYDKFSVKVYNILKDQLSKLPKIFIEKNHDYELRFQEYQIKKLIPLNSPDNLFIVLTQKSQFILCNANSKKYECQFSLMNIPKIQNNYYNEENIIPQADLLISENSYQQIIENQTFQNNSSIIYQNPNQSYIQNQQQMQQLIHSNNIKKQNENSNSLFKKFVSFFKKCNQEPAFEQELKKQIIPDVPLVIILEAKYIYYIKLRDLVFKQFDKISNQQNLPSYGKYVCGIFHPMNKSQILFINDSKELIIYDYISDLAIIKLHFAESLLDLQYFSFEKRNYLVIKDFSNLFISKLDLEYPAEAQNFQKIKSGQIRQVIMFPRCLAQQTGTSVKSSYRNQ
ncbi:kinase domain protein (macronuclear) [Tetrahymena thermophila SB210]|uniref:non-specific serine/threonine protein kinase n=1 Tax=Tetrahymena thermophila (strain SB210) TaxID=312017 RepID=Q22T91_TETTS|nr:kinase domain protein [Tetrahymena thermophila SB210]EAR88547.1 kinase domain protein [Tetrahymena thermophila SB210]|eukprot:XP_001008792.1 kinase domain protein [Tetrahymena thermophila SB210]